MSKIEPGCLAIVINDDYPANIGIICKVGYFVGDDWCDIQHRMLPACWYIESLSRPFYFPDGDSQTADMQEQYLKPVSGLPDEDDVDTEEPIVKNKELSYEGY